MGMKEKVENTIKSFLEHLSVPSPIIDVKEDSSSWKIMIRTQDDRPIVGQDGERFESFSHLMKRMLSKVLGEEAKIILDVNERQARNEETLKAKAYIIADRAVSFKHDVEMDPMSSYERMIIHSALEGRHNIKTESIGSGKDRRLVVKYIEKTEDEDFKI